MGATFEAAAWANNEGPATTTREVADRRPLYIPGDAVCIAWRSRKREEAKGGDNGIYVTVEMNHLFASNCCDSARSCDTGCFKKRLSLFS